MNQDEEHKQDTLIEQAGAQIEELKTENRKLRLELHTLRFKESQEQRFIWWIYNVYSRNVQDLILDIMGATTYDTEGEAKEGKYSLPKHCFDLMKRIDEYTEHIYDGTYLDVEMGIENKDNYGDKVMEIIGNALSGDYERYINYAIDGKKYCKWGIVEKDIRALFEDTQENNKPSDSDVSVTQDVLINIKKSEDL